ncbi:hypothetical protein B0T10DRAFT_606575 [Thelonectria olida]|uniref:Uncharacterized protein n=1 Tax=Thelonectria olida TaxID=1576542 RepID=A0A9P8W2X7_9HYPO|nr:hypothetical protein B0T10DRAFT_606575 [Thelonectria olida]
MGYAYDGEPLREGEYYSQMLTNSPVELHDKELQRPTYGCPGNGPFFVPRPWFPGLHFLPHLSSSTEMVAVVISRGQVRGNSPTTSSQVWFKVDGALLRKLLPRTCNLINSSSRFMSILHLDRFLSQDSSQGISKPRLYDAFCFLFGHLEEHSRLRDLKMFELAERLLDKYPSMDSSEDTRAALDWGDLMCALCALLHNQTGLGCSPELLILIANFLEKLFRILRHRLGGHHEGPMAHLFDAFTGIFGDERSMAPQMGQIRRIWAGFDVRVRELVMWYLAFNAVEEENVGRADWVYQLVNSL